MKKIFDFEINDNDIFIGIGHKAQQGKDTVADFLNQLIDKDEFEFYKMYFVDALVDELKNPLPNHYLFKRFKLDDGLYYYEVPDKINNDRYIYKIVSTNEAQLLHEIFEERNLIQYNSMNDFGEKDSKMMQFWGDYRRNQDEFYWIKKSLEKIYNIQQQSNKRKVFVFTNTRFKNELNLIKEELNGIYLKVIRYNQLGDVYIDYSRDPNHISEIELNDVVPDFTISAFSSDIESLKKQTIEFLFSNLYHLNYAEIEKI